MPGANDRWGWADWRRPLLLILGIGLWRLALAWLLPVVQDEAYYFDWARRLAWGYFDHPPGVALLGIGTWLAPGSALAARLGTLLAGILALLVLARFYRRCGLTDPAVLTLALLLAAASLPGFAGGLIATPDTPLMLAWALALHESERALAGDRRRWLGAGLAVGLGLLGKYTMVLIGPVLLWAILRADPRALRTPWPWLGGLLALLVFLPHLTWNARNDWLTLRFQIGHGFAADTGTLAVTTDRLTTIAHSAPSGLLERLTWLLDYLGTQLALWGLLLLPMGLALALALRGRIGRPGGTWRRIAGRRPPAAQVSDGATAPAPRDPAIQPGNPGGLAILTPQARALLTAATLFPLAFFALVATGSEVEANWPGMYLLGAAPLLALWLHASGVGIWTRLAAGGNLLLIGFYALYAAAPAALPLPDNLNRILRETHGFDGLARLVATLDAPVHADRYQTVAMLRFHARGLGADPPPMPARARDASPDTTSDRAAILTPPTDANALADGIAQWPGLSRPSEYLRGHIAPLIRPDQVRAPFWLVSRQATPPELPGLILEDRRRLFDCAGQPPRETAEPPCGRPLRIWFLYRYSPVADPSVANPP